MTHTDFTTLTPAQPNDERSGDTSGVVLVVGDASSPVAREDLTAFASDVADRLQLPAKVAVGRDYDVKNFAGVVLADTWLDSVSSVVLGIEAQEADMCVIDADMLYAYSIDTRCGHCGEYDDAAPVLVGNTWTTSVCAPCAAEAARVAATRTVAVAA
ncbi:hypothetical protein [Streptomyces colonosanans]|uniref:Uncharacterized protein n=1 Tax=Streptomyces colonosanans TaxID=1428652 RepID=A0A1S2PBA5_9ACTN|nr:hypothetical protein [Streptomyces colonosanans]OIJ90892.1 hypothetical protein BIV24_17080 [Streptomyces colonosanans]